MNAGVIRTTNFLYRGHVLADLLGTVGRLKMVGPSSICFEVK